MSALNTDASTYRGPSRRGLGPAYPLWMYHPVLAAVIVTNAAEQAALIAADSRWSPIPSSPNPLSSESVSLAAVVNNAPLIPAPVLLWLPPLGGSVVSGLEASSVLDGTERDIRNTSSVDTISFLHLSSLSLVPNQFCCPQGALAILQPLTVTRIKYVINQWVFS